MTKRNKSGPGPGHLQRYEKIQQERLLRQEKKSVQADRLLSSDQLGPEQPGQIIAHYGANLDVEDENGEVHHCLTRRNLPRLVCGDYVTWQTAGEENGVIVALTPRSSLLTRPDYMTQLKPVAANIDQILIVAAPKPDFDENLINRYLVAAHLTGITPAIVLNKIDLLDDKELAQCKKRLEIYSSLGYQVIHASNKLKSGLDELRQQVRHHTSIFAGQSGVGKSSLINTLIPDADIRVGEISKATGLGKHTTTVTVLYHLDKSHLDKSHPDNGGNIIDSPGVREFGLGHVTQQRIAQGFIEFSDYLPHCKFNDCTHHSEPGCAIRQAVADGHINKGRLDSYFSIVKSLSRA